MYRHMSNEILMCTHIWTTEFGFEGLPVRSDFALAQFSPPAPRYEMFQAARTHGTVLDGGQIVNRRCIACNQQAPCKFVDCQ